MTDSLGFLDQVASLPEQLAAAHEAAGDAIKASDLPDPDTLQNIVVLGMGGSGIAGDVFNVVNNARMPVPVTVLKQYRTPGYVGPGTLAFALSYSGNTEETLSMAEGAAAAGATLVTVSSGGELANLRRALHIECAPGYMPRSVLGTLVAPLFVSLFRMGVLPDAHALLVKAAEQLAHRRDRCQASVTGAANPARVLARQIDRTIPLIYGGGAIGAVAAMRWKCDVNENAKAPAFWAQYPELDHNEICGWGQHGDVTRQIFTLIELRHGSEHDRLSPRFAITRELIEECVAQVLEVQAEGEGRLAQLLDLMYVGDWVSCYLALQNDVDPGPVDAIAHLKRALA